MLLPRPEELPEINGLALSLGCSRGPRIQGRPPVVPLAPVPGRSLPTSIHNFISHNTSHYRSSKLIRENRVTGTNADYTVDFTQGTCTTVAGFPVGACCEVVSATLRFLSSFQPSLIES